MDRPTHWNLSSELERQGLRTGWKLLTFQDHKWTLPSIVPAVPKVAPLHCREERSDPRPTPYPGQGRTSRNEHVREQSPDGGSGSVLDPVSVKGRNRLQ